jgi:crotonobetainyl-CoA:carnitine CoA-transferase CaiB-like acyl-CoA transferase
MVEVPMVESALNAAAEQVIEYTASGTRLQRIGNRDRELAPQGVYACRGDDSWLAISVPDDGAWVALRHNMGDPSALADASLDHVAGRLSAHDRIDAEIARWCAAFDAVEVADRLAAAGVPAEPVVGARRASRHPQLRHRGFFEVEDHPVTGAHELPSLPFRMSGVTRWIRRAAPTLGQHTDEVLRELGVDDAELDRLRAIGVIGTSLRRDDEGAA